MNAPSPKIAELRSRRCKACAPGTPALDGRSVSLLLGELAGWGLKGNDIEKTYKFRDHHQTMAFVNAVAWISHTEDHHPTLEVGYNRCKVRYSTHAAAGLTDNDFICASKVDALFEMPMTGEA